MCGGVRPGTFSQGPREGNADTGMLRPGRAARGALLFQKAFVNTAPAIFGTILGPRWLSSFGTMRLFAQPQGGGRGVCVGGELPRDAPVPCSGVEKLRCDFAGEIGSVCMASCRQIY